jgi:poly(A) polymerase
MQEIWLLQARFAQRQRKRVHRLLAHPRFRAAWDFLQLRQHASDEHAEDIAFFREMLGSMGEGEGGHHDVESFDEVEGDHDDLQAPADAAGAPRRRRRRRRRTQRPAE